MKTFMLIIIIISRNGGGGITTVPTEYISEAKCTEAGKVFTEKWQPSYFACIPSGNAP